MNKNTVVSRYTIKMDRSQYRLVKAYAAMNDTKINDLIVNLLNKEVSKSK